MDYSKMSDAEIGRRVAAACKLDGGADYNGSTGRWETFDPCNNPADAWPIIVENKICLEVANCDGRLWLAEDWRNVVSTWHKDANPLRAAMIVYLKMQESANVQTDSTR